MRQRLHSRKDRDFIAAMPTSSHTTSWDDFRLVKAIAETRSLNGAAEMLALNHSTVFRRLGALEEALGARLFERSRNGYSTTSAGEDMVALAQRMGEEIDAFERKAAGRDEKPSGDLRVTTNDTFLVHLLTPIFASFADAYPEIRLDIVIGNQALNLSRRDADIAVRATAEPPETLVGRRISDIAWARYAPDRPGFDPGAADAKWVGFGDNLAGLWVARVLEEEVGQARIRYRVNTPLGLAEAVAAGIGMGMLPCFIGDQTPGIVRFGPVEKNSGASLWLLTHPDLRHAARVRAFMDHAGAELMKRRRALAGE